MFITQLQIKIYLVSKIVYVFCIVPPNYALSIGFIKTNNMFFYL